MRIPEVDGVHAKILQALFACDGHVGGVAAEVKGAIGLLDSTKLRGDEDIISLAGPGEPPAYERL